MRENETAYSLVLKFLRRYWPVIPIAVVLVAAVFNEWSTKNTPQPPLYAAASQIPPPAASNVVASSTASQTVGQPEYSAHQQASAPSQDGGFPWVPLWIFCTFAATAVLAGYAVRQLGENRRSSERQLRAYVFIDAATCRIENGKVGAKIRFKNFGATPASNVVIRFDLAPGNGLPSLEAIEPKPKFVFAPTGTITISHAKPIDAFLPVEQRGFTHVIGRVDYTDSFGHSRWTNFKMRYIESAATSDAGLQPTEDGNDFE